METATLETQEVMPEVTKKKAGRPFKANKAVKPYQFKQQANGMYKAFCTGTDTPFAGFEDKFFKSPLEGGRILASKLRTIDDEIAESQSQGFEIPIINGHEPVILIEPKTKYFEVIIREHDEPKRTSEPISDGYTTTYYVALGKKVILPESVINTAKEAIYTVIQTDQDPKTMKCTNTLRESPRFYVEIIREVPADEAKSWLLAQKRVNINIF